ncbi:MAG: hypothetical protein HKN33_06545 [Pyrinomonadaceae bacterium]|nr:hypothetical protein [Pyrinomonadaceae bacterium]
MYFRKEWNTTGVPLAYLISFRTYGTWLHGDSRGSTDRNNNVYGDPFYPVHPEWERMRQSQLKSSPVKLNRLRRKAVNDAVTETCILRKWHLIAKAARTNHVHVVVNIGDKSPGAALNALKAYATRKMRELGLWNRKHSPWAARGSKKRLWTEEDVDNAVDYVLNGQGPDLD